MFSVMMAAYISTIPLFVIDLFGFDERQLGLFMFAVGFFISFNQVVMSKIFIKKVGEYGTMQLGMTCAGIGLVAITLTDNLWLYLPLYYILNLGVSLCMPPFRSLLAKHSRSDEAGEVMGIGESIVSLSNALIPVLAAFFYTSAALGLPGSGAAALLLPGAFGCVASHVSSPVNVVNPATECAIVWVCQKSELLRPLPSLTSCTATLEWSLETSPPALGGYLTDGGICPQGRRLDAEKRMLDLPFMAFPGRSYETVIEPLMADNGGVDRARQQFVDAAACFQWPRMPA